MLRDFEKITRDIKRELATGETGVDPSSLANYINELWQVYQSTKLPTEAMQRYIQDEGIQGRIRGLKRVKRLANDVFPNISDDVTLQ